MIDPQESQSLAIAARRASHVLARSSRDARDRALTLIAQQITSDTEKILVANRDDIARAKEQALSAAFVDRLALDAGRIAAIADAVTAIAALDDPLGRVLEERQRPNGLTISRVSVPLGVIGIVYESRPNVTADAAAICLKAGNAVILRGGSDSAKSTRAIASSVRQGLAEAGLPEDAVQLVPSQDRDWVGALLSGLHGAVDVVVPRGGRSLVERVQADARVPVIGHLEGLCHTFVHHTADLTMASEVVVNAKMRRVGICGALETLLIDERWPTDSKRALIDALIQAGCELRGDASVQSLDSRIDAVSEEDWTTEYLAPVLSVAIVADTEAAITHIARYGSGHTDAIVCSDALVASRFLAEVDSAIVMHNASTQFADGGEFGLGAEIGISTGKFHARGPVGTAELTSYKHVVRGTGQTRT
ncbi:MAG: glutamate-5-semialdehyde dehydrogenase [Pseudomonadota bacterium]